MCNSTVKQLLIFLNLCSIPIKKIVVMAEFMTENFTKSKCDAKSNNTVK